jgi:hypothetical protein
LEIFSHSILSPTPQHTKLFIPELYLPNFNHTQIRHRSINSTTNMESTQIQQEEPQVSQVEPQVPQEKPQVLQGKPQVHEAEQQDPKQPELPRYSNDSFSDDEGSDSSEDCRYASLLLPSRSRGRENSQ